MYDYKLLQGCINVYKGDHCLMIQGKSARSLLYTLEMCETDHDIQKALGYLWDQKMGDCDD